MGVSIREVLEHGGYEVTQTPEDARWLLNKKGEIKELLEIAELVDEIEKLEQDLQEARSDDSQDEEDIAYYEKWIRHHREELNEYNN